MFCDKCGSRLNGNEKFCPVCGNEIIRDDEFMQDEKNDRKRMLYILVPILISCAFLIFLAWMLWGNPQRNENIQPQDELNTEISSRVDEIIAPYVDEEGLFECDEAAIKEAGMAVYDYALELAKSGRIEDAAWCEEGSSVSFFLNDGSTTLYIPSIKDTYSGYGDLAVGSFKMTSLAESINYREPADTITDNISSFQGFKFENDATIEQMRDFLGSLNENNVRALFWQGHGGLYTEKNGETILVLTTKDKKTPEKESLYAEDRMDNEDGSPKVLYICNNKTYGVNYKFFEKYTDTVNGGLFFCGACYSLSDGDSMAQTFLGKGFDAYVGTTGSINQVYSNDVLSTTAEYLVQQQDGVYMEISDALYNALEDCYNTVGDLANFWGAEFELRYQSEFRLIDEESFSVEVTLDYDDFVDPSYLSINCMKLDEDESSIPYANNIYGSELDERSFTIRQAAQNDIYQIDIIYDGWTVKSEIIDFSLLSFESGMANVSIDLDMCEVSIIPADVDGKFLSDANIQIYASDDENGIVGLIQEPRIQDDRFYIVLSPGEYNIQIVSENGDEINGRIYVEEDSDNKFEFSFDNGDSEVESNDNIYSAYSDVIAQYEEQYGELEFNYTEYEVQYMGVFLLKLVDFDSDGTQELIIGYTEPNSAGAQYVPHPNFDVWTIENGEALCVFERAYVQQSDIGRHCLYTYFEGENYIVTGWAGSNVDIELWTLKDGEFVSEHKLESVEITEGVYVTGMEYYMDDSQISSDEFSSLYDQIYSGETYGGALYEYDNITPDELASQLNEMKDFINFAG